MERCNCEIELEVIEQDNEIEVSSVTNAVILKGFSPYIKDGTWWEYDKESQTFVDTGVKAQGKDGEQGAKGDDGFSPRARVEPIIDGAKVIVTDKSGTTEINIHNGEKGEQGVAGRDGRDGKDGSDYVITEADYEAIANVSAGKLQPTITDLANAKADKTDIPTKVSELENDSNYTTKAYVDEEIAKGGKVQDVQVNGTSIVSDGVANISMYSKNEIDDKIAEATPSDYEQVKDDIALLKWKTLNLATEVVDSTEAYSKSVPNNVYEKALLNRLGGKSEVVEGSIVSANVESVVSEGANLWDEQTKLGYYSSTSGLFVNANNQICTANKIDVAPNQTYTLVGDTLFDVRYYNGDVYISGETKNNGMFTTPTDCNKVNINLRANYGTTYKNDIAIIKGTSGTYTPYHEPIVKPISTIISKYFPNGMHSVGSVYDEIDLERGLAITRTRQYDAIGSYEWEYQSTYNRWRIYIEDLKIGKEVECLLSNEYTKIDFNSINTREKVYGVYNGTTTRNRYFYIRDTSITTIDELRIKLNNVSLVYELATPTETPLTAEEIAYLEALQVESNGTITFANAEMLQVPNEESYLKRVE